MHHILTRVFCLNILFCTSACIHVIGRLVFLLLFSEDSKNTAVSCSHTQQIMVYILFK